MAIVEPHINQIAFLEMMEEIIEVVSKRIDSVIEWQGELGAVAEIVDNNVFQKSIKPVKKKLKAVIRKMKQEAILTSFKKPRKLKLKESSDV